jgi:hypothetical protein
VIDARSFSVSASPRVIRTSARLNASKIGSNIPATGASGSPS